MLVPVEERPIFATGHLWGSEARNGDGGFNGKSQHGDGSFNGKIHKYPQDNRRMEVFMAILGLPVSEFLQGTESSSTFTG